MVDPARRPAIEAIYTWRTVLKLGVRCPELSGQSKAADPAILDEIPYAGDILPTLPPALKARLFAAFDLAILWNKAGGQATVSITITDATLAALLEILDPGQLDTTTPTTPHPPAPRPQDN